MSTFVDNINVVTIMYEDILLTPLDSSRKEEINSPQDLFISFLNKLEGWKTKCKNLHWAAPKKNITCIFR